MNQNIKACIAYIAGTAISGRISNAIYDYDQGKQINYEGSVTSTQASIYDYARDCYIQGEMGRLYDYGLGAYIQLILNGNQFSGYDAASDTHFSGEVHGNIISMHGDGHSSYSI